MRLEELDDGALDETDVIEDLERRPALRIRTASQPFTGMHGEEIQDLFAIPEESLAQPRLTRVSGSPRFRGRSRNRRGL